MRTSWKGAKCDQCPLSHCQPVEGETAGAEVVVIEATPSRQAAEHGALLGGPEGTLLPKGVGATYLVACRPPLGDLNQINRKARKLGLLTPAQACRPRLDDELAEAHEKAVLVPAGGHAMRALGIDLGEDEARGAIVAAEVNGKRRRAVPTHTLDRAARQRWLEAVVAADLDRAQRWFDGQLQWREPKRTDARTLDEFWRAPTPHGALVVDIETDGIETGDAGVEAANIRCIGIGGKDEVTMVIVRLGDGTDIADNADMAQAVSDLLEGRTVIWHNGTAFDHPVLTAWWKKHGVRPPKIKPIDTILVARMAHSQLPRALGYLSHCYTDSPAWKEENGGLDLVYDEDRWRYCARDVAILARMASRLIQYAIDQGNEVGTDALDLLKKDTNAQILGRGMTREGLLIDADRVALHWDEERAAAKKIAETLPDLLRAAGFEPSKYPQPWGAFQARSLLVDSKQPLPADIRHKDLFTPSGMVSTNDLVLCRMLPIVSPEFGAVLGAVRKVRWHLKRIGTYIAPWSAPEVLVTRGVKPDRSRLYDDGKLHPRWAFHQAATGRYAATGAVQGIPADLRDCIVAAEGWSLIYCDMDQLEFRIAAARWGADDYLLAIREGIDVHQITMAMTAPGGRAEIMALQGAPSVYGKKDFEDPSEFVTQRQAAKITQYLSQYEGGSGALFRTLVTTENDDGDLVFSYYTPLDALRLQTLWKERCAAFVKGWEREKLFAAEHGIIREDIGGRWRSIIGASPTEIVNFPIQAGAAAVMNRSLPILHREIRTLGNGRLLHQGHDSVLTTVPDEYADRARLLLNEIMPYDLPEVRLTCKAKVCRDKAGADATSRWSYA